MDLHIGFGHITMSFMIKSLAPWKDFTLLRWGGVSSQRWSRFRRATLSLATFICSHPSLRPLALQRSTLLCSLRSLALFKGSLIHFIHSLVGQLKFLNICSHCYRVSREQTRFWRSLETRPESGSVSTDHENLDCSVKLVFSVNTYSWISTIPRGSEWSEWTSVA